jgi:hypothetical protein
MYDCCCSIDSAAKLAEKRHDFGRLIESDKDFKVMKLAEEVRC